MGCYKPGQMMYSCESSHGMQKADLTEFNKGASEKQGVIELVIEAIEMLTEEVGHEVNAI
jgi:hypothetical protein